MSDIDRILMALKRSYLYQVNCELIADHSKMLLDFIDCLRFALNEQPELQARIQELEAERRWIPVSEWLPEMNQDVLAMVDDEIVCGSFYQDWEHGFYFSDGRNCMLVATHWMPLPEPPVSEEVQ